MKNHTSEVNEVRCAVGPFTTQCLLAGDESAPPVLLLHDGAWGGCGSVSWGGVIPRLAKRYHVIVPDMLGFGATDKAVFLDSSPYLFRARHVLALLDELGVTEKVQVAGNSFGGTIALRMLEVCAERVSSAVTINGTGGPNWRSEFGKSELAHWDGSRADLERILDLLVDRTPHFDFDAQLDERLQSGMSYGHYRAMNAPSLPQPAIFNEGRTLNEDWPAPIAACAARILLVGGLRDPLLETNWIDELSARLHSPKSTWLDTKHSPNIDDPAAISELLDNWFSGGS